MADEFLPILGGLVPPEDAIGRDKFIEKMWRVLERTSVVLVSERRIGKTTVLKKMEKEALDGWRPIYLVVEGVRSPMEFIRRNYEAVAPLLTKKNRALTRLAILFDKVAGEKIGAWHLPELNQQWKDILTTILRDIGDNFKERIVFLGMNYRS